MLVRRILILILSILTGLLSRSNVVDLPTFIETYIGDVIWAFMVFYLFSVVFYKAPLTRSLKAAFIFSFVIEFSQLYQAEWINTIRSVKLFALVLGHGFLWTDLLCYSVGIIVAFGLESFFLKSQR